LTLTTVVEVDVALVVEPIVDLDPCGALTCKVKEGVDVHVAVKVEVPRQRRRQAQRLRRHFPAL